jgi:hypothetical protein
VAVLPAALNVPDALSTTRLLNVCDAADPAIL